MILEELVFNVDKNHRLYLPPVLRNEKNKIVLTYINQDTLVLSSSDSFNVENFLTNIIDKKERRKFIRYISASSFLLNVSSRGMVVIPEFIFDRFSFSEECVILKTRLGFIIRNKSKYLEEQEIIKRKKLEC